MSRYKHHPALRSFPTRRSSDLWKGQGKSSARASAAGGLGCPAAGACRRPARRAPRPRAKSRHFRRRPAARSEEHTSELQSREKLVCRLLLEKKKTEALTRTEAY